MGSDADEKGGGGRQQGYGARLGYYDQTGNYLRPRKNELIVYDLPGGGVLTNVATAGRCDVEIISENRKRIGIGQIWV